MIQKILILNMTRMGDLIQSTPLIEGLHKKYPQAGITMIISSDFVEFASRIAHVNENLVFNLRQFNERAAQGSICWVEIYRYLQEFLDVLAQRKFDLVVNLSHSKLSALMISYLGIKNVRGFLCDESGNRKTEHPWMQYFGTEPFNRNLNSFNLVDIFTRSGDIVPDGRVHIKTDASDDLSIVEKVRELNIQDGDFIVGIQAGSSIEGRRWSAQSFAEMADLLANNMKAKILLFGVASESKIARDIVAAMTCKDRVIDLTGKTKINELIAWLKKCQYLITNDTGTMHLASALGTKIVALFFAHAHPYETGPYGPGHLLFQARIPCAPCSYGVHCNNIVCINKVRPHHLYSMISGHRKTGQWSLAPDMGNLDEMNIFETVFDEDCFMQVKPLIKRLLTPFDVFLTIYRKIWMDTINGGDDGGGGGGGDAMSVEKLNRIVSTLRENYRVDGVNHVLKALQGKLEIVHQLKQMGEKGAQLSEQIIGFFKPGRMSLEKIKRVSAEIDPLDKRICQLGLTHYEVKPICDMFNKRKENLQGDDVLALAKITKDYYRQMTYECKLMIQAVDHINACLSESRLEHHTA